MSSPWSIRSGSPVNLFGHSLGRPRRVRKAAIEPEEHRRGRAGLILTVTRALLPVAAASPGIIERLEEMLRKDDREGLLD